MRSSPLVAALATASIASTKGLLGLPLDVGTLLATLKPAAENDPRFTDFHPAGNGDGMLYFKT
jgi:hypothetical protein